VQYDASPNMTKPATNQVASAEEEDDLVLGDLVSGTGPVLLSELGD
jgi:hypothetical protein